MAKPLAGIKVVEMSTFVAGPVTARLLADLGAEVIKVERPEGDGWRLTGVGYNPNRFSKDENPVFDIYNTGKKHIALNLKTPAGMEAFHRLLAQADVFVTNTRPKALQRLGISYEDLKDKYPGLVYGILLGYGEEGPDAAMQAFDTSAYWARGGFLRDLAVDNGEDYVPVQPPFSVGDTVTGYMLMGQICAALCRKKDTGLGDYVRAGLYHNGIFTMGTMAIITQPPFGREYPAPRYRHSAPSGSYRYVVVNRDELSDFDIRLRKIFRECVISYDYAQNLVVLHTMPGLANAAASALDHMSIPELVGTLAGDDTVFLAMKTNEAASLFYLEIEAML